MPFRPLLHPVLGLSLLASMPCIALPGLPAHAQGVPDSDADRDAAEAAQKAQAKADAKAAAPPPAIPGAVTDEATATSGHASADMEPTAALFDAINRGDIVSAKEALGRGADLNGRNVLGQNPLDMSIDLNRSDITFLLLSMRNRDTPSPDDQLADANPSTRKAAAEAAHPGRAPTRAERLAARRAGTAVRQVADNGTPKPEIGFLGFGGS